MRGRPSLPIGSKGQVWTRRDGKTHTAYCYYRDVDGVTRRVKASAASAQRARDALDARLDGRALGTAGVVTADSTVTELAQAWQATLTTSQKTKDSYAQVLRSHIIPGMGALRCREVTVGRVDAFLQGKKDAPSVAVKSRVVLSLMFALAARYDAVQVNPIRETKVSVEKRKVKAMTVEEGEKLRAHIAEWAKTDPRRAYFADMTDLFIATGLRPGEMLGLLWTDFDFKARTLTVTGTLKRDTVQGLHRQDHPKSEAGERTITVPDFVWPMLARRKLAAKAEMVFPNRFGAWLEPSNVTQLWRQACGQEWAGVKQRDFRTAVATLIARESGAEAAAGQLGHSSDAVTRKHYIEKQKLTQDNTAVLDRKTN
ncbi:site-specific integrase [Arthrobacter sp. UYCu723]